MIWADFSKSALPLKRRLQPRLAAPRFVHHSIRNYLDDVLDAIAAGLGRQLEAHFQMLAAALDGHARAVDGGPEPILASEPLAEPNAIPPEEISGEAASVDFAG
jgi:hypothetical protein